MTPKVPLSELQHGITLRRSTVSKSLAIEVSVCTECEKCVTYHLVKPILIAIARDTNIVTQDVVSVNDDTLKGASLELGQDALHTWQRAAPEGQSVGTDVAVLRSKMLALVSEFASEDSAGKTRRLFHAFLEKHDQIEVFTDPTLDQAVAAHENFIDFSDRTLAAPGTKGTDPAKVRIHQALKNAAWDIAKVKRITDLGIFAFNKGSPYLKTKDFNNGLKVMINGVQYVYVYAERYDYTSCKHEYEIELKFVLYDVFGLDDEDLRRFGASSTWGTIVNQGFTAWWQLQHQFDYAPLLTRAVVRRTFTVSTKEP